MRSVLITLLGGASLIVPYSAAGCGGQLEKVDGADAGQGDAARVGQGGTLAAPCPATQPQLQDSCATIDLRCEYGGAGPHLRCDFIFQCDATGHWTVEASYGECGTPADNASSCPKSFAAIPSGTACPPLRQGEEACVYAEGLCGCANCSMVDGGYADYPGLWSCDRWPAPPLPCPPPRPRIGSACTTEGQQCAYEPVCSPLIFDQRNLKCSHGLWQDETIIKESCPTYPMCGK